MKNSNKKLKIIRCVFTLLTMNKAMGTTEKHTSPPKGKSRIPEIE